MNRDQYVKELRSSYRNALDNETACSVHLFGIKYGEVLRELGSLKKLAEDAGIPGSYAVEINKGINLSKYVILK